MPQKVETACVNVPLDQGPKARSPPDVLTFHFLYLIMHFSPPSAAQGDIFSPYAAREFVLIQNAALTLI